MSVTIRRAGPADAAALTAIALAAKSHWGYPDAWLAEWRPQLTLAPDYVTRNPVFVLEESREPVGFCALAREPEHWLLDHLWVSPAAHGRGYGRALFRHAVSYAAAEAPALAVRIESDPNAEAFYAHMGARRTSTHPGPVCGLPRELPVLIYETQMIISRPAPDEYAPYYGGYIDQVPDGDVLDLLQHQIGQTTDLISGVAPERGTYRYAPEKWCLNDVLGHLCDTERVFTYRALRFSRGDAQALPGMEQDDYVTGANFADRSTADLLEELQTVRAATITLLRSLTPEMLARRGTASDCQFTARAIAYVIAGHERHHVQVLRERYLER